MRRLLALLVVVVAVWITLRRGAAPSPPTSSQPSTSATASAPTSEPAVGGAAGGLAPRVRVGQPDVGFRSAAKLDEHFAKHGAEFGNITKAEYLRLAQQLRDAEPVGDILEIVRPADGVVSRFDKKSGAFEANDRDGTIRTFFKPNDGEAYFRRQARRRPEL